MASPVRLVVLGRQGAGKGTQCARLAEHYGALHISTGDMLRAAVAEGTEFGRKANEFMSAGELVPDDVMLGVVTDRLAKPDAVERGFLLDGYPRNVSQAEALDGMVGSDGIDRVIDIDVPLEVVLERIKGRGREDDTEDAVRRRLELYESQTRPLTAFYDERNKLATVDGVGSEDEVFERLCKVIDEGSSRS
ncbi:MAG: adenylate kinase [Actinomycetota bacterium]|nr:adenylate kinase [Actinomycetota bacterium]